MEDPLPDVVPSKRSRELHNAQGLAELELLNGRGHGNTTDG